MKRSLGWMALAGCGLLTACGGDGGETIEVNTKPTFVGAITKTTYDGTSDDLLTAGLGKSGLQKGAPAIADPNNPTAAELRRLAIYNNYRALVDIATNGGFGVLYGPNVDVNGVATSSEGKIAGTEYVAYDDDGSGKQNVTMMVQVPTSFNPSSPCIITATSSGSRGVYGAIATAGEWGLKHGCAVAYTDKGSGNGFHDLQNNKVTLIDGRVVDAATAGSAPHFTSLTGGDLANFNAATPNRFAFKHAHSQQNPEKNWGKFTLDAVQFAFFVLNEQFGSTQSDGTHSVSIKPDNTIVIASSVSNGAGAALAAAEQDTQGLIDGVAVGEPQVQLVANNSLSVVRGSTTMIGSGKTLLDYFTFANLYQPCAALAASAAGSPSGAFINTTLATNRCASLKAKGLLTSTTPAAQAEEAMNLLIGYGWQPETKLLQASHWVFAVPAVAVTYANAYTRSSVKDNLCGFSFAATSTNAATAPVGTVVAAAATAAAKLFGTGNGVPPTSGINIVQNNAPNGPIVDAVAVSPSTGVADYDFDGALCLRNLVTGSDALAQKAQSGVNEVRVTGNLRGKPTVIVQGRSDTLVPIALTSRPYFGMNKIAEGPSSKLSFVEVTNANHFDAFIDANPVFAGYDSLLVPLHVYVIRALDAVFANLKNGTPLPPSQVVRTVPRGGTPGAAPAITSANVPPLSTSPGANAITFSNNVVTIPD